MSDSNDGRPPLPEGPWGFPGMSGDSSEKKTDTPAGKKIQRNRSREKQAKLSRKINRHA